MKSKKNIVIVVLTLLISVGVWYFLPQNEQLIQKEETVQTDQRTAPKSTAVDKKVSKSRTESAPPPTEKDLLKMIADNPQAKKLFTLGQGRNKNISFYGKVIDQHGEPVSHAKVTFNVGRWSLLDPSGYTYFGYTDANGVVEFKGEKGFSLSVRNIEKQGYVVNTHSAGFRAHAQYQGDTATKLWKQTSKDKPYIFHAWKKTRLRLYIMVRYFRSFSKMVIFIV